jgi:hypothetical protein
MAELRPEVRIIRAPELGNSSFLVADSDAGEATSRATWPRPQSWE